MKKFWMMFCMALWISFFTIMVISSYGGAGAWRINMLALVAVPIGLVKIFQIFYRC